MPNDNLFSCRVETIDEAADFTLDAWSAFEVQTALRGDAWELHFTGFVREGLKCKASSRVVTFDPVSRRGVTRSGRIYHLAGRPGATVDAMAAWGRWRTYNEVVDERDVTYEVEAEMANAGNKENEHDDSL